MNSDLLRRKGFRWIVSDFNDFNVCFLVPLDISDIATPNGTGWFLKIKTISCQILDFWALALVVYLVSESWL
jgi:hypothetical protein